MSRNSQISVYDREEMSSLRNFLREEGIEYEVSAVPNGWHFNIACSAEQDEEIEWFYATRNYHRPTLPCGILSAVLGGLIMLVIQYVLSF